MNSLLQDFRFALRQLRKSLGFSAVAIITLALGIAVNSTMFSLVSGFLLRRPPGRNPERLAVVSSISPEQVYHSDDWTVSVPNYLDWRQKNSVFESMAADSDRTLTLGSTGSGHPEALHAAAVSPNYFEVFGASPQIGRAFADGEDQPGRSHVIVLGHELWERHFGSDPAILGRTLRVNRENWTVVGVMPASFRMMGFTEQLWIPLEISPADHAIDARKTRPLRLFARLKPGVTVNQARAEIATLAQQTQNDFPDVEKGWGATVRSLPDFLIYDFGIRPGLIVMMTAVGFVLMIACANVAGLLLARAAGRQKELSIRFSLGARRWHIVRQLLAEGFLISILGGVAGLLLSVWGISFVRANTNFNEAISSVPLSLDRNVLLFTLGASLFSAVLSSLIPALRASTVDLNTSLTEETRGSSSGRVHNRLRNILVTGEIAVALFLLVGAGLLISGVFLIEHQNLGFQPDHLLTAEVTLDAARYKSPSDQLLFVQDLLPRLQHVPGVESAAVATDLPATGSDSIPLRIKGEPELPTTQHRSALDVVVTSDYFHVAGIPLLRGRTFADTDNAAAPRVVIVSQEFVRRHLAGQDPLGKQIRIEGSGAASEWSQIVGVVGDVKSYSEEVRYDPEVYEPYLQRPVAGFSIMLRANAEPGGLSSDLRATLAQLDPELPLARVMSMPAVIERQKAGNPFFTRVLGCFALLALVLAAIGIYGLIAYSVSRRTHEIGIRLALGARTADVLRMILGEGVRMALIGGGIGFALSLPLPKLFDAIFFGLHFREPWLYFIVPAAILMVALLATYIPARRAGSVDPMVALRYE